MTKGYFVDMIMVKESEMETVAWVIQVGPIKSHESLKTENLFQLGQKEEGKEI